LLQVACLFFIKKRKTNQTSSAPLPPRLAIPRTSVARVLCRRHAVGATQRPAAARQRFSEAGGRLARCAGCRYCSRRWRSSRRHDRHPRRVPGGVPAGVPSGLWRRRVACQRGTASAAGTGERAVLGAAVPTQDTASRMDRQAGRSVSSSSGCDESLRSLHGDWRAFLQSNRGPPSCVVCRSAGVADDGGEGG
jgi:hypothetical protein